MLLVVLSVFGARSRCLGFIEAAKAAQRRGECSLRTGGGMEPPRGAPGLAIFWCSNANGGLLYWLVEGAEASREGEADLVLALSADELLIDAVAGSTGYRTKRMIR